MAGLTHADEGLTFDAAYDLLGGLDPADLHEWEDELFAKTGQRLRFATRDVSVEARTITRIWPERSPSIRFAKPTH